MSSWRYTSSSKNISRNINHWLMARSRSPCFILTISIILGGRSSRPYNRSRLITGVICNISYSNSRNGESSNRTGGGGVAVTCITL